MLFFGLVWVTSWIGYFFSSNYSLPASLASKEFTTRVSTNVTKLVTKHRAFSPTQNSPIDTANYNAGSLNLLSLDWGNKQSSLTVKRTFTASVKGTKKERQLMCRPTPVEETYAIALNSTNSLSSALIEPDPSRQEFLPNKILRSLQNFFRFSDSKDQSLPTEVVPVQIVHRDKAKFEVWLNNNLIATLPNRVQAKLMQQSLTQLAKNQHLDATQLRSGLLEGMPALMLGNRFLFVIDKQISAQLKRSGDLLAIEWVNNLRQAFKVSPLGLIQAQQQMYGIAPTEDKFFGFASWYGPGFHGRLTATGEIYDQDELTAAHPHLPFNTYLQVTNLGTGRQVIVRVNDRGPYIAPRTLDLSREAARCLNSEHIGVVRYEAVIMRSVPTVTSGRNRTYAENIAVISNF